MMLAVVHGDADVLQWKARHRAFDQRLANALLHCRDELARNRATDDFVHELETLAALERLDAQEHLAELPRAAGLLLVAAVSVRLPRDRLAIGDAWEVRPDVHAVTLSHP